MKNDTIGPAATLPCPVGQADQAVFARVMRSLLGKWKTEILWTLVNRKHRFGELRKALPGITQHMLTAQLRELEADGLVKRTAYPEVPPRVEYEVTAKARDLTPVFDAFGVSFLRHCALIRNAALRPSA